MRATSSIDVAALPFGATVVEGGVHFCVYSSHATAVDLCLFETAHPQREQARVRMRRGESGRWHAFVPGLGVGALYGYRAHGPWRPREALRFNANKLLLDPYARAIAGDPAGKGHMLGAEGPRVYPGSYDNGQEALKSVVVDEAFDWQGDCRPRTPWRDTVVYELHVKGFTQLNQEVPKKLRGTYAGLAQPAVLRYLKDLGITAVQLLPVHQHLDDQFLVDQGLTNYWGYNTVGFFAPHCEYAAARTPQDQVVEFKEMVRSLHAAGLEVILDVVYNHTAEGDERGPSLMFRGLDDAVYYRHTLGLEQARYLNCTGVGNSVDSTTPASLRLIMDSLRYWVTEMHVDGFRFDLAVTVARDHEDRFNLLGPFLSAVAQDPVLSQVKLIAEPWDVMMTDSYQVGGFPEPWRELNGKYRDSLRRFWSGEEDCTAEFAKRQCGSEDIFRWSGRGALSSINFITSHDGFTLLDLVSYSQKHNEANGEDNRDGDNHNHSVNCGVEGPTQDPRVAALRARLRRSMMASMLTAVGVPFINAGDERGRTQRGNNNAYCQDNNLSWLAWNASETDQEMIEFVRRLIQLRKTTPALRRIAYFDGKVSPATGLADVNWLAGGGGLLSHAEWHNPKRTLFGALLDGVQAEQEGDETRPLLLLYNGGVLPQSFLLPSGSSVVWMLRFDTSHSPAFAEEGRFLYDGGVPYALRGHSVAAFLLTSGACRLPSMTDA